MDWSGGGGLNGITKHTWLRVNLAEWSNKLNPLCENSKDYPCVAFLPPLLSVFGSTSLTFA